MKSKVFFAFFVEEKDMDQDKITIEQGSSVEEIVLELEME